jgi:hypothetical protein
MLFKPKLIVSIGDHDARVIQKSLSSADYERFRDYARTNDGLTSLIQWATDQPALTIEQIKSTWKEDEKGIYPGGSFPADLELAEAKAKTKFRALRVALSTPERNPQFEEGLPVSIAKDFVSYSGWERLAKRS